MSDLRQRVFENLDSALENDAFGEDGGLYGYTPREIAGDMVAYADDVGDEEPEALVPHVEAWLLEKGMLTKQ